MTNSTFGLLSIMTTRTRTIAVLLGLLAVAGASLGASIDDELLLPKIAPASTYFADKALYEVELPGGTLQMAHIDMELFGPGGFKTSVARTYSSNLTDGGDTYNPSPYRAQVNGWSWHFGRLFFETHPDLNRSGIVLEMPGSGAKQVIKTAGTNHLPMITTDGWELTTIAGGYIGYAPNGLRYFFKFRADRGFIPKGNDDPSVVSVFYVTRIEDLFGNYSNIIYDVPQKDASTTMQEPYLVRVDQSDGQWLNFSHIDCSVFYIPRRCISSVTASDGRSVSYTYENYSIGGGAESYQLREVTGLAGYRMKFSYILPAYIGMQRPSPQWSDFLLVSITGPQGGEIKFSWRSSTIVGLPYRQVSSISDFRGKTLFNVARNNDPVSIGGAGGRKGSFVLTKTLPTGSIENHYFYSAPDVLGYFTYWWNMLPYRVLSEREDVITTWWAMRPTSNWRQLTTVADGVEGALIPLMQQRKTLRDGVSFWVDRSDFDEFGNATRTAELSPGSPIRDCSYVYVPNLALRLLHQQESAVCTVP